jgi:hypothetical protein
MTCVYTSSVFPSDAYACQIEYHVRRQYAGNEVDGESEDCWKG